MIKSPPLPPDVEVGLTVVDTSVVVGAVVVVVVAWGSRPGTGAARADPMDARVRITTAKTFIVVVGGQGMDWNGLLKKVGSGAIEKARRDRSALIRRRIRYSATPLFCRHQGRKNCKKNHCDRVMF